MLRLYILEIILQTTSAAFHPYAQIVLRNMGFSQSLIGVIIACTQLSACIIPLFISNIADKTGKIKLFFFCSVMSVFLCYGLSIYIPKVLLVAIFYSLAYGSYSCITALNDTTISLSTEKYGGTYATVRATGTIGYVIALTTFSLTNFPAADNNKQIFTVFGTSAIFLLLMIVSIPNPVSENRTKTKEQFFDPKWFHKGFYLLTAIIFVKSIGCAVVEKLLGSYMTEVLHLGNKFSFFVALGATSELILMILFGKLLKKNKIKENTLIILSCIGLILRLSLYVISKNIIVFTIAQLLHALTYGASHTAVVSYISKTIPEKHTNLAIAIYTAIAINLAQFLGSIGGGFIIDYLGYNALFTVYTIFPAVALVMCFTLKNKIYTK